jgi:hypothetical protein
MRRKQASKQRGAIHGIRNQNNHQNTLLHIA